MAIDRTSEGSRDPGSYGSGVVRERGGVDNQLRAGVENLSLYGPRGHEEELRRAVWSSLPRFPTRRARRWIVPVPESTSRSDQAVPLGSRQDAVRLSLLDCRIARQRNLVMVALTVTLAVPRCKAVGRQYSSCPVAFTQHRNVLTCCVPAITILLGATHDRFVSFSKRWT